MCLFCKQQKRPAGLAEGSSLLRNITAKLISATVKTKLSKIFNNNVLIIFYRSFSTVFRCWKLNLSWDFLRLQDRWENYILDSAWCSKQAMLWRVQQFASLQCLLLHTVRKFIFKDSLEGTKFNSFNCHSTTRCFWFNASVTKNSF